MEWQAYKISANAVADKLGVSADAGLNAEGVKKSRLAYGANTLSRAKKKHILRKIADAATEPMMLILLLAFAITLAANCINAYRGDPFDYPECVGIFAAIAISVFITLFMEGRSAKAFEALNALGGSTLVKALRDGESQQIPLAQLVVGDIVKFGVGDKIPVDCRLLQTDGFEVDESPLTGESHPVEKDAARVFGPHENPPLAERVNMAYGGCFVTAGFAAAAVTAVGDKTEIGGVARDLENVADAFTPLQEKIGRLGKTITVIGAAAAAFVFALQLIHLIVTRAVTFDSVQSIFITSIILIVAAVPEGLPTIVAVSFALNVIKMAKEHALVKKMAACETVGNVSVICSDKTGTLTENKMTVTQIRTKRGGEAPERVNDAYLLQNFCLNTTADVSFDAKTAQYTFVGNPTEGALLAAYHKTKPQKTYTQARKAARVVRVYPFSGEFKRMTTVTEENGKYTVLCKGAPEVVLGLCTMGAYQRESLLGEIAAYQREAKRVIAFAHAVIEPRAMGNGRGDAERGLIFDGYAVIADPVRKDVYAAVAAAFRAGIEVKMLTGDNMETAAVVARALGILSETDGGVYTARDIELLTDEELKARVAKIKIVARSTPATKLRIVNALKAAGEVVAVTGDGINDAPAVKAADVGIAMGVTGTEVCKAAADIVVLNDSFSTIVTSVRWGRGIYENFQRFILFQLTVNFAAVAVTVLFILLGLDAPFNALQLLWINIIMDGPPALTLGLEPIGEGLLDRKPVGRNENIVTQSMTRRILANVAFITALLMLQALTNFMGVEPQKQRTFIFALFIVLQLCNAFNARALGNAGIAKTFWRNKPMLVVMLITFCVQILIVQTGGAFNTVPLAFADWLKVFGAGISIILFSEAYKAVLRQGAGVRSQGLVNNE